MDINSKLLNSEAYSTPEVKVVDIVSEGLLCASGLGINDWERDDEALDFV